MKLKRIPDAARTCRGVSSPPFLTLSSSLNQLFLASCCSTYLEKFCRNIIATLRLRPSAYSLHHVFLGRNERHVTTGAVRLTASFGGSSRFPTCLFLAFHFIMNPFTVYAIPKSRFSRILIQSKGNLYIFNI